METATQPTVKASELRIGNWILCKGKPTKIESIDDRGINHNVSFGEYGEMNYDAEFDTIWHEGEILPIPLTPEILEKCGFQKIDVDGYDKGLYHEKLNHGLYGDADNGFTFADAEGADISAERSIKYLHQLQNLYFALTGEELPINL